MNMFQALYFNNFKGCQEVIAITQSPGNGYFNFLNYRLMIDSNLRFTPV